MSCSTNITKTSLAAVRCGITQTANKTLATLAANKDAIGFGTAAGAVAFRGKQLTDQAQFNRQALLSKTYDLQLSLLTRAARVAATAEPEARSKMLTEVQGKLEGMKQNGYSGLPDTIRQDFFRQHQVVEGWLNRATAALKEEPLAREFMTGAARASEFGMKGFVTPAPRPPSTQKAALIGLAAGATTAALFAAGKIAARHSPNQPTPPQPAAITQKPVRNSSFVSAAGYDEQSQTLRITFKSGRGYDYHGVPADVARGFLDADKKGAFFHHKIKGAYRISQLEPSP